MKLTIALISIIFTAACLAGCNKREMSGSPPRPATGRNARSVIRLQQQWFANSGFAGELCAMHAAKKYNVTLKVIPGSDQIDTKQIVKLGEAEFGVAGAEQVLQANEKGANLVVVGVINPKSLACFISKKKKGIMKPTDFKGHKIGTMEGSPVDLVYQSLKKTENFTIPSRDEVPTQWVLTGFIRDQYDVYPAFINDEPVKLRKQGIELNVIKPGDYGVNFIGTVYFCKRELLETSPETVQTFVSAMADGWNTAIRDPRQAITYLKEYDKNIDEAKEMESLRDGLEYYKGEDGKVLYCKEATWTRMASLLQEIGTLKTPFQLSANVDNKFVDRYHSKGIGTNQ